MILRFLCIFVGLTEPVFLYEKNKILRVRYPPCREGGKGLGN